MWRDAAWDDAGGGAVDRAETANPSCSWLRCAALRSSSLCCSVIALAVALTNRLAACSCVSRMESASDSALPMLRSVIRSAGSVCCLLCFFFSFLCLVFLCALFSLLSARLCEQPQPHAHPSSTTHPIAFHHAGRCTCACACGCSCDSRRNQWTAAANTTDCAALRCRRTGLVLLRLLLRVAAVCECSPPIATPCMPCLPSGGEHGVHGCVPAAAPWMRLRTLGACGLRSGGSSRAARRLSGRTRTACAPLLECTARGLLFQRADACCGVCVCVCACSCV